VTKTEKAATATTLDPSEAKRVVRRIIAHHFGNATTKDSSKTAAIIEPMSGGITNHVFSVKTAEGDLVVRLGSNPAKLQAFMKEQWAIAKAREQGVPTPEVLQVSNDASPIPYMISRHTSGTMATTHPDRLQIVKSMGRYAAMINQIPTTGFGSTFEWSHNQLSHNATWSEFLHNELKLEERLETLSEAGMLEAPKRKKLRTALESACSNDRISVLNHGDLRLKNVLVNTDGDIVCILDWEHCASNLSPEWELSIALHDLSIDEKQELLKGYGLTIDQIRQFSPAWKMLTVINYAPSVQRAVKARNTAKLDWFRLRLSGVLDLYEF
jgi:aminoglycoside phosphotransferase (APT) family kinase protein